MKRHGLLLTALLLLTAVSFYPSLDNDFTYWDDGAYVTENKAVQDLSFEGVIKILTSTHQGLYKPLVFLTFAIEHHFFKLNPLPYHITNLVLHLLNALLVYLVIYMISKTRSVAWIVAVFFAVHPMHVESVAWVTERKDLLYALFYLLSIAAYLFYTGNRSRWAYGASLACFGLSLCSKPSGILLPFVLILLDYLRERPADRRMIWDKIPFFVIAIGFGWMSFIFLREAEAYKPWGSVNIFQSFHIAAYGFTFYIVKLFVPHPMSVVYPYPTDAGGFLKGLFWVSPYAAPLILGLGPAFKRATRIIPFGIGFYLLGLLPVLQLVRFGPGIVADRYTYIPYVGLFYILAEGIRRLLPGRKPVLAILGAATLGSWMCLTYVRCDVWKENFTLWKDVIRHYPTVAMAYVNRGNEYSLRKRFDEALADYNEAIRLKENYADAYVNRGNEYARRALYDRAVSDYDKALTLKPDDKLASMNRILAKDKYERSVIFYTDAIEKEENMVQNYFNRANVYADSKEYRKAESDYRAALQIDPASADAHNNLGSIYQEEGRYEEAMAEYDKALRRNENLSQAHYNRALILDKRGRTSDAREAYRKFLECALPQDNLKIIQAKKRLNELN